MRGIHGLVVVLSVATVSTLVGAGCGGNTRQAAPLTSAILADVPSWVSAEKLPPSAIPGAKLFAETGCTSCHTYLSSGNSVLGAPDLTAIGARHLGVEREIRLLKCPACVHPGSPMPTFAALGGRRLHQLALFLEASGGRR